MDKVRVMPILAGAVMAVSLTACQGMMGGKEKESGQQASSAPAAPGPAGQQAMSTDLVRDVQRGLSSRGYDVGPQDGVYGAGTEQALRKFQRDQHMNASGQVDAQTLAALGVIGGASAGSQRAYVPSPAYTPTSKRQGAMATHPSTPKVALNQDQVRSVQQNLADRGFDPGKVDGSWGPRTQTALRDFQRDQNIQANGRPNPQTLAALGVESGSPSTQTGQLPAENPRSNAPQRNVPPPAREPGELPPTGSQAPGAEPETERAPISPGGAPDMRANPPD